MSYNTNLLHSLKNWNSLIFVIFIPNLVDIFQQLNILNTSMQGNRESSLMFIDKMKGFWRKPKIWKQKAVEGYLEMFPFLSQSETTINSWAFNKFGRKIEFVFPITEQYDWIRNPFTVISTDCGLMMKHKESSLESSWISAKDLMFWFIKSSYKFAAIFNFVSMWIGIFHSFYYQV